MYPTDSTGIKYDTTRGTCQLSHMTAPHPCHLSHMTALCSSARSAMLCSGSVMSPCEAAAAACHGYHRFPRGTMESSTHKHTHIYTHTHTHTDTHTFTHAHTQAQIYFAVNRTFFTRCNEHRAPMCFCTRVLHSCEVCRCVCVCVCV